jgi:hypothetical protein
MLGGKFSISTENPVEKFRKGLGKCNESFENVVVGLLQTNSLQLQLYPKKPRANQYLTIVRLYHHNFTHIP